MRSWYQISNFGAADPSSAPASTATRERVGYLPALRCWCRIVSESGISGREWATPTEYIPTNSRISSRSVSARVAAGAGPEEV